MKLSKGKCPRAVPKGSAQEQQPQAPVPAGGQPAGKQLGRKRPEGPGGHEVENEEALAVFFKVKVF